ncbi:hypothetical protein CLF_106055 [Clonorchis sinensis]|uniref:Pol-related protein n=1 Tax=Clonorchis sinensis TaxID=79923 RepID=G7YEM3_CLOSI|nr:hypothetical protein CLF_106055 [Clonorchis sinensis]
MHFILKVSKNSPGFDDLIRFPGFPKPRTSVIPVLDAMFAVIHSTWSVIYIPRDPQTNCTSKTNHLSHALRYGAVQKQKYTQVYHRPMPVLICDDSLGNPNNDDNPKRLTQDVCVRICPRTQKRFPNESIVILRCSLHRQAGKVCEKILRRVVTLELTTFNENDRAKFGKELLLNSPWLGKNLLMILSPVWEFSCFTYGFSYITVTSYLESARSSFDDDFLEKSAQKTFAVLRKVRRTFSRITRADFQILYEDNVRQLLEYANPVVYSGRTNYVILIERVQRAATKVVAGLKFVDYETRFAVFGLTPLEYLRL